LDKKPLTFDVSIDVDNKPLDKAIEKTNRLVESLKEAVELIKEINELENKTEPAGEKEAKN
jgi:hypothetical protein